ncbi:class I SAM-dependent methyltransferase [Legionella sp. CNM-4043-24]|uniref:class I SAM-dependent methyltransferase n=1 Tax=Legionella sp. CNM-4043-24 TaxID=3421646 RepID=UPI00403A8576
MPIAQQKSMFHALDEWFVSEQGRRVAHAFLAEVSPLKSLLYGDTLVQLGSCGHNELFRSLRYVHKTLVTPGGSPASHLLSSFMQLPIACHSVDCVIAPLTLNAFTHEKNPLGEIDRILKPGGYMVYLGINPFSLWGCWLRYARRTCFGEERGALHSVFSVKRAMLQRGYVQASLSGFYYIPPFSSAALIKKMEIFNVIGRMISPMPAGFFCLVLQKYQECGILVPPLRRREKYHIPVLQAASPGLHARK